MPLTPEQQEHIISWLRKHVSVPDCPFCGNNKWTIAQDLFAAVRFAGGGVHIGGRMIPLVLTVCSNCGYVRSYAAGMIFTKDELQEKQS